jgi:hypothetical protein
VCSSDLGEYPKALTLQSPEIASLRDGGAFGGIVSAIEDYTATPDAFSLVITGKGSRERIRITQTGIEEVSSVGRP